MKNKTKKITKLLCAVLLIVVLQSIGYTYAKYIAQDKTTGEAEIAKWSFKIGESETTQTKNVQLVNTATKSTLVDGKIAPGSSGKIYIALDGAGSEVDIDYYVQFANEKNKPTNLKYTYYGTEYSSLSEIVGMSGTITHDDEDQKRELIISWEWPYETGETTAEIAANDEIDTQEANLITEYTFDIIATGTQKQ